jgi:cysteine sulfinate desulfinase/cysteine desulfurase-like protein
MFLNLNVNINVKYVFILIIITIIIILIVIIILKNYKMSRYLNYNSSFVGGDKSKFNPSDIYYTDNIELKTKEDMVKTYLLTYVNAPESAKVIFNSGASESIANCMLWAKSISKFGTVLGSELDHPSVKENAENIGINYSTISYSTLSNKSKEIEIPQNTVAVFMTGVCPKTGEIYPIQKLKKYNYLLSSNSLESDSLPDSKTTRQIKPLKILDASQMIGKIPIDMSANDLNAVFFSCHKIGGDFNTGVLIINEPKYAKFKPLISGSQQEHLRGGTYNSYAYLAIPKLLKEYSSEVNEKECKEIYDKFTKELDKRGIKYYKPVLPHTYGTILIKLSGCNAKAIHALSEYNIYVGSATACQSNNTVKELRISYLNKDEFGKNTINKICDVIQEVEKDSDFDEDENENENENEIKPEIEEEQEMIKPLEEELKFEESYI